jgi:hypothetical protein
MTSLSYIHFSYALSFSGGHQIKYSLQHLQLIAINWDLLLDILIADFPELKEKLLSNKTCISVGITCMEKVLVP